MAQIPRSHTSMFGLTGRLAPRYRLPIVSEQQRALNISSLLSEWETKTISTSISSSPTQQPFNFLALPLELRRIIYEFYYEHEDSLPWAALDPAWHKTLPPKPLSMTCRQLRTEIRDHGYVSRLQHNTIQFVFDLDQWQHVPANRLALLRSIEITNAHNFLKLYRLRCIGQRLAWLRYLPNLRCFSMMFDSIDCIEWPIPTREDWFMATPVECREIKYRPLFTALQEDMPTEGLRTGLEVMLCGTVTAHMVWSRKRKVCGFTEKDVEVKVYCMLEEDGKWKKVRVEEEHDGYQGEGYNGDGKRWCGPGKVVTSY